MSAPEVWLSIRLWLEQLSWNSLNELGNFTNGVIFFLAELILVVFVLPWALSRNAKHVWHGMGLKLVGSLQNTINSAVEFEATYWMAVCKGGDSLYLTEEQRTSVEKARNRLVKQIDAFLSDFELMGIALQAFPGVTKATAQAIPLLKDLREAVREIMKKENRRSFQIAYQEEIENLMLELEAIRPGDGFSLVVKPSIRTQTQPGLRRLVAWVSGQF